MEKKRNTQLFVIIALTFAVVIMSVGFATFSQDLKMTGNASVGAASWDVHFKSDSYAETTGSVEATNKTVSNTTMSYSFTLTKPGDFYEFTINVENKGTFDADLAAVTLTKLTDEQKKYLTYKLTYDGTEYTTTSNSISGVKLAKETGTASVKVRVEYVAPENSADLPTDAQSVTLDATLSYNQSV